MPRSKPAYSQESAAPDALAARASAHREFMWNVAQTHKQWRRTVDRLLAPQGLSQAQWLPLMHLAHAPEPLRQKDLAMSLGLDSSSVVRLVDGLVAKGWVTRLDDVDRRVKKLQLTEDGEQQVAQVEHMINGARLQLLEGLSPSELAAGNAVLDKLIAEMNRMQSQAVAQAPPT